MLVTVILGICLLFGVNGNKIAGGVVPEAQKYPFAASLITNNGQGTSYSHACGGVILTANALLSAASCFYTELNINPASWWRVRVGSNLSNSGGTIYTINRIIPHTDFSPATSANDIAVLRTSLTMVLVPGSVEIARISGAAYTFTINQQVLAIGWGATSNQDSTTSPELREVQIWAIDQTTCSNRWSDLGFTVTANMVCVGWLDVGVRGQCSGDNGSPLLDINGGFVIGVFSRSNGCAQGWYPDVNTRVAPYINWIRILEYFGDIARKEGDNLEKLMVTGKIEGKRSRGRSPMRWSDQIRATLETPVHEALKIAANHRSERSSPLCRQQIDMALHCKGPHPRKGSRPPVMGNTIQRGGRKGQRDINVPCVWLHYQSRYDICEMFSSALIAWIMCSLCEAIVVNKQYRDIVAKSKIELTPILISCKLNDMAVISIPTVDCENPLYYLYKPNGDPIELDVKNMTKNYNTDKDSDNYLYENEVLKYIIKSDIQTEYPRTNYRVIDLNYGFGKYNKESIIENQVKSLRSSEFLMGPFTIEDHGNWMLSVYCKDIDDNWIEMYQTISVEITEHIPLRLSNPQPKLGDTLKISFEYPIKDLESCELVAPRSTYDRYYDRSKSEPDRCGYIITNVTLDDSGIWTIIGVGRMVYEGMMQLNVHKELKS